MRYAAIFEKTDSNYSAYVPDLPGCIATGSTLEEVASEIQSAILFHIEGLQLEGLPIPEPKTIFTDKLGYIPPQI
jgi:predicted RNase H-like HicB family nuclease